jgi:hypothetical protein
VLLQIPARQLAWTLLLAHAQSGQRTVHHLQRTVTKLVDLELVESHHQIAFVRAVDRTITAVRFMGVKFSEREVFTAMITVHIKTSKVAFVNMGHLITKFSSPRTLSFVGISHKVFVGWTKSDHFRNGSFSD